MAIIKMKRDHKRISLKTRAGIFSLEISRKGLYSVRFPGKSRKSIQTCNDHSVPSGRVFRRYFKDPTAKLNLKLDLSDCTLFERKVYQTLLRVPTGKVVSYGELAMRAGYPGAARAVGTAMKKNRLPIVIPCHRVIPASGGLGEYAGGKKWKRWLLEHEQYSRATRDGQRAT